MQTLPKKIVVKVTKEDIKRGKKTEETSCPIALAIRRALAMSNKDVAFVGLGGHVRTYRQGEGYVYWTPTWGFRYTTINGFIRSFDRGRRVKPFSFKLKRVL